MLLLTPPHPLFTRLADKHVGACVCAQSYSMLCNLMDCSLHPLPMEFSKQEYWSGLPFFLLLGIFIYTHLKKIKGITGWDKPCLL